MLTGKHPFAALESTSVLKTVPPTTADGIERYLGSGLVKGIGPVLAKKLVGLGCREPPFRDAERFGYGLVSTVLGRGPPPAQELGMSGPAASRRNRVQSPAATPHTTHSQTRLPRPSRPVHSPRLNAPWPLPASPASNIDSRFPAICPAQNSGQEECRMGQRSCMASCEVVDTTIRVTKTL